MIVDQLSILTPDDKMDQRGQWFTAGEGTYRSRLHNKRRPARIACFTPVNTGCPVDSDDLIDRRLTVLWYLDDDAKQNTGEEIVDNWHDASRANI